MPPSTVIPELVYEDVEEAIGWLCDKFGFQVRWHKHELYGLCPACQAKRAK